MITAAPSQNTNDLWLVERYPSGQKDVAVGKWLIYRDRKGIDHAWAAVKKALRSGELGSEAKCVTARGARGSVYVICVYTADHNDNKDVMRVRDGLFAAGFTEILDYKTDEASWRGIDEYKYRV